MLRSRQFCALIMILISKVTQAAILNNLTYYGLGNRACHEMTCRVEEYCSDAPSFQGCRPCKNLADWCHLNMGKVHQEWPSCEIVCERMKTENLTKRLEELNEKNFNIPATECVALEIVVPVFVVTVMCLIVACIFSCILWLRNRELVGRSLNPSEVSTARVPAKRFSFLLYFRKCFGDTRPKFVSHPSEMDPMNEPTLPTDNTAGYGLYNNSHPPALV